MARPVGGYRNAAGKRVPGASTIAKLAGDPEGLQNWFYNQGLEGKDPYAERDKLASAGTLVHEAAEAWKQGQAPTWEGEPDVVAKAQVGYGAFLEWAGQTRLKVDETELSLVSETFQYGGTMDASWVGEKRCIIEYKTAASLYPEMLVQVSAYGRLWLEHFPDKPLDGGFYVIRFSRDFGDFTASWFGELDHAWETFVVCRRLYDLKNLVKARCR